MQTYNTNNRTINPNDKPDQSWKTLKLRSATGEAAWVGRVCLGLTCKLSREICPPLRRWFIAMMSSLTAPNQPLLRPCRLHRSRPPRLLQAHRTMVSARDANQLASSALDLARLHRIEACITAARPELQEMGNPVNQESLHELDARSHVPTGARPVRTATHSDQEAR
jgi:hypothetical protein